MIIYNRFSNLLIGSLFLASASTTTALLSERVLAHIMCPVKVIRSTQELCPHLHPEDIEAPGETGSCTQATIPPRQFIITNNTGVAISYAFNGGVNNIPPNYSHTFSVGGGSNGCSGGWSPPRVSFDHSFAPGNQIKEYSLDRAGKYHFGSVGNTGIDLYK